MWEVIKHVLIRTHLGVAKDLLRSWKRNKKENDTTSKEEANTTRWAVKINESKVVHFHLIHFQGQTSFSSLIFSALWVVSSFFWLCSVLYFSASFLCFILNCDCSEMGFDGRVLAQWDPFCSLDFFCFR